LASLLQDRTILHKKLLRQLLTAAEAMVQGGLSETSRRYGSPHCICHRELLGGEDRERTARVTQAFLKMKKFDIAALKRAAVE
jgi:hypothetical protein